jgi:hypothetical protein
VALEQQDIKDIMACLGEIKGQLAANAEARNKSNTQIILALIGLSAAQIGVKVLGTPILLDIATVLAFVGVALLAGVLLFGLKVKRVIRTMTRTGIALAVMVFCLTVTQITVYFRDLGMLTPDTIYAIRIVQNISIITFAWMCIGERHLYRQENNGESKPSSCKTKISL